MSLFIFCRPLKNWSETHGSFLDFFKFEHFSLETSNRFFSRISIKNIMRQKIYFLHKISINRQPVNFSSEISQGKYHINTDSLLYYWNIVSLSIRTPRAMLSNVVSCPTQQKWSFQYAAMVTGLILSVFAAEPNLSFPKWLFTKQE